MRFGQVAEPATEVSARAPRHLDEAEARAAPLLRMLLLQPFDQQSLQSGGVHAVEPLQRRLQARHLVLANGVHRYYLLAGIGTAQQEEAAASAMRLFLRQPGAVAHDVLVRLDHDER